MPVAKVHVQNFKGISHSLALDLKPITLFVGPNSSGKSSVIHALACLAQSAKLSNEKIPLVLDDARADVHLGRYVEVVHGRSYSERLRLGVTIPNVELAKLRGRPERVPLEAVFEFSCTRRTQAINLQSLKLTAGDQNYEIQRKKGTLNYDVRVNGRVSGAAALLRPGLQFAIPFGSESGEYLFEESHFTIGSLLWALNRAVSDIKYLGPFRESPKRRYPTRGADPTQVGAEGADAMTILANESIKHSKREVAAQVARWLDQLGLGKGISLSRVGSSDLFDVGVTLHDDDKLPLADLGYGLSQVLPVLVQCSFAKKGEVLLFEQPELHLHHSAARALTNVFCDTVSKGVMIVAETHSYEFFGQFINELRAGRISLDDIVIYDVKRVDGCSRITRVPITEEDGDYEYNYDWSTNLVG